MNFLKSAPAADLDAAGLRSAALGSEALQLACNGCNPPSRASRAAMKSAPKSVFPHHDAAKIEVGSSVWNRLSTATRQYAHKLRQALASALELHVANHWGRGAIEAAGRRDYECVFGHAISSRHFWRVFDLVIQRAGNRGKFEDLVLYLPGRLVRKPSKTVFERLAKELPTLASQILRVRDAAAPTAGELLIVWDSALSEYQRLADAGMAKSKAVRIVVAALDASGLPLARARDALRRNFGRKLDRWVEGGCKPSAICDLRPDHSGSRRDLPLSEEDLLKLTANSLAGGLSRAWRDLMRKGDLSPDAIQAYIANPASKSYVPRRVRDLVGPNVGLLQDIHHGPRQAQLNGPYISRDWSQVAPGDWYQADDCTLPVYYWEEDGEGRPHAIRGQFLVMIDCRTQRVLAFALHSERNYSAKVIRGLTLRTHDTYGLPRKGFYFERGIWKSSKLITGAADEVPLEETELGLREFCEFVHARLPRAKLVERILGILQTEMEDQPGYVGRDEKKEKFERVQKNLLQVAAGRLHPSEFLLHRDEWMRRLETICDRYNHEPQDGRLLKSLSPREAWEQLFDYGRPLIRLDPEYRFLLANHRRPLKVTANGICVQLGKERHWFRSEQTGLLRGRQVQVYFNPEDLSSVFLQLDRSDKTALVVPAAPTIPAMSATAEQLSHAMASCEAHNRAARTLYAAVRSYFPENGPSPFRRVVADPETVEMGQEIAEEQAEIRNQQKSDASTRRQLARYRHRFGVSPNQDAISEDRLRAGYEMLAEANRDAQHTPPEP